MLRKLFQSLETLIELSSSALLKLTIKVILSLFNKLPLKKSSRKAAKHSFEPFYLKMISTLSN